MQHACQRYDVTAWLAVCGNAAGIGGREAVRWGMVVGCCYGGVT